MNGNTKNLIGSIDRDLFRAWHKHIDELHGLVETQLWFASDTDLNLLEGSQNKPIAVIDYQRQLSPVTNSEKHLYDYYLESKIPVFLVVGKNPDWLKKALENIKQKTLFGQKYPIPNYQVYKYIKGGEREFVTNNYIEWERNLRENISIYKKKL